MTREQRLKELVDCQECGMACEAGEYHPFAACLMFKACHNSSIVRANLPAILNEESEGWVLVPREPTAEMYLAAQKAFSAWKRKLPGTQDMFTHNDTYAAMIAAAPTRPADRSEK